MLLHLIACAAPTPVPAWEEFSTFPVAADADGLVARRGEGSLRIALAGFGRGDVVEGVAPAGPEGARGEEVGAPMDTVAVWRHGGLDAWWGVAGTRMESGFQLLDRPEGDEPVTLRLTVSGAEVVVEGDGATLTDGADGRWRYDGLHVVDATGRGVAAWMEPAEGGLAIRVDDAGATWPLSVDPFLSTTTAVAANLRGVTFAGYDINADGYSDFGAYEIDDEVVSLWLGGASGPTLAATWSSAMFTGINLAFAPGDYNGDGYDDLAVGDMDASSSAGAILVFFGSASGYPASPGQTVTASAANTWLGTGLHPVGDLDADGRDDLVASALTGSTFWIYLGASGGLSTSPLTRSLSGLNSSYLYRGTVSSGDFNGDGYRELVVGDSYNSSGVDTVRVARGTASGPVPFWGTLHDPFPGCHGGSGCTYGSSGFGQAVQGVDDVDGDGRDELEISAPWDGTGRTYLYYGTPMGVGSGAFSEFSQFGEHLTGAGLAQGDFNGDGCTDLVYSGIDGYEAPGTCARFPTSTILFETVQTRTPISFIDGYLDHYGWWQSYAIAAGDVNGDGQDDLLVSNADGWDDYTFHVAVLYGSP